MSSRTDIQVVDDFCEKCLNFINPLIFREINERGLGHIVNFLPKNVEEAKAVAHARMAKLNKFFDDEEINGIANTIQRVEFLKKKLTSMNGADVHQTLPVLEEMTELSLRIKNYYK